MSILLFVVLEYDTGCEVYQEYHVLLYDQIYDLAMKENVDMGTAILKYLHPEDADRIHFDQTPIFNNHIRVANYKKTTIDTVRFLRTYVNIHMNNVI